MSWAYRHLSDKIPSARGSSLDVTIPRNSDVNRRQILMSTDGSHAEGVNTDEAAESFSQGFSGTFVLCFFCSPTSTRYALSNRSMRYIFNHKSMS